MIDAISRRGLTRRASTRPFCWRVIISPGSVTKTGRGDLLLHELGEQ